jgi:hypothetical protein
VTLDKASSIAELAREQPGAVDAAALARLNGVAVDSLLPEGRAIKQVRQGPAPQ